MSLKKVMSGRDVARSIGRLAHEISEQLGAPSEYALVGIVTGGEGLAERLAAEIQAIEGSSPMVGSLDITLYRDDLYTGLEKPVLGETKLPFSLSGLGIVLVDDVLFTGRTVRAAMDEVMDYGRPRWMKLAVLVDRGHRELPIAADFVGRRLSTSIGDKVVVHCGAVTEGDVGVEVVTGKTQEVPNDR